MIVPTAPALPVYDRDQSKPVNVFAWIIAKAAETRRQRAHCLADQRQVRMMMERANSQPVQL